MKPNCLIIDDMHTSIISMLEASGIQTDYEPQISREAILERIKNYEGIIVRSKIKIDHEFLNKASNLKYIARAGAGKDNIDTELAEKMGITILNAPEGNRDAVAEHVIGMILNLINKISSSDKEVRNNIWKREANRGKELSNLTVGIIGFGNTGRAVAKRITCFGCKVLANDIREVQNPEPGVINSGLQDFFDQADIVSIHIPLDSHNRSFINKDFFSKFKKPIWFINSARGEVVNTHDLVQELNSGKVLGAGLDVLENEKLESLTEDQRNDFEALCAMPNVILTPHVAGWTHESYKKISEVLGLKIDQFYKSINNQNSIF